MDTLSNESDLTCERTRLRRNAKQKEKVKGEKGLRKKIQSEEKVKSKNDEYMYY